MPGPVRLHPGKLEGRPSLHPVMAGNTTATMYILDKNSNTKFLVDSGAEVSLFPAAPADRASGAGGPHLLPPTVPQFVLMAAV